MSTSSPSQPGSSDWKSNLEESLQHQTRAFFVPEPPRFPSAVASIDVPNPLLGESDVRQVNSQARPAFCQCNRQAGERCAFCWAWEPSETHSIPTVWSAATSMHTSVAANSSNHVLAQGQRVLWLQPEQITSSGGTVVIAVKREIPQELWTGLEVRMRSQSEYKVTTLKPEGVRKGKKIALKVPQLPAGDYDVSVHVGATDIPGVLALEVSKDSEQ